MIDFELHTIDSASPAAKELLKKAQKDYGMIPSMHAALAESPQTLEAVSYTHLTLPTIYSV